MKKILSLIVISLVGVSLVNYYQDSKIEQQQREQQLVNDYVECLNNNFTQRYYCASQVSDTSYQVLDQLIEKYGYTYQQNGYDLQVVKK